MLVLSRKRDERIVIGHNITIVIVEVRGDKVRLGIEAPKDVPVNRQEVLDEMRKRANANAANCSRPDVETRDGVVVQPRRETSGDVQGSDGDGGRGP